MKKVSIVIVNWNGVHDTERCLVSIGALHKQRMSVETIVVDNGSTDRSMHAIAQKFPWVILLSAGTNLGFSGGNNLGIQHAYHRGADYIWLLNNDTFVDPYALSLVDAFGSHRIGIAGSKIYFAPGHEYHRTRYTKQQQGNVLWYAGGLIDWKNMYASHRGVDEVDHGQYDRTESTPFVSGCSMMISRILIDRIGMLDEKYYLYLEDLDYCERVRRAGFSLMYVPSSRLWHINAGSSGGAGNPLHEYYQTRNRLLFGMRFASLRTKVALLREGLGFMLSGPAGKRRAVADAMRGRWGKQYEPTKSTN